jgi:glycosyltransferase involved in cell wall biosynthesis
MKIAVTLITYNQEKYIEEALDGIRLQSRVPDEVVIADDGSTDSTQLMIRDYVVKYSLTSWKLLLSKNNRGINENLSTAINNTTAEIIIGMAGDDVSLPTRCQITEDIFRINCNVSMIATSGLVINELGETIGKKIEPNNLIFSDFSQLIKNGFVGHNSVGVAFKRDVFVKFPPLSKRVPNEDDQICFRAMLLGGIFHSSEITYKYRKHEESISSWNTSKLLSRKDYSTAYLNNLKVRSENFRIWLELCQINEGMTGIDNVKKMIGSKIEFLEWLSIVESTSFFNRFKKVLIYRNVLCRRDVLYALTGKVGIIAWSILRGILMQAKRGLAQ